MKQILSISIDSEFSEYILNYNYSTKLGKIKSLVNIFLNLVIQIFKDFL